MKPSLVPAPRMWQFDAFLLLHKKFWRLQLWGTVRFLLNCKLWIKNESTDLSYYEGVMTAHGGERETEKDPKNPRTDEFSWTYSLVCSRTFTSVGSSCNSSCFRRTRTHIFSERSLGYTSQKQKQKQGVASFMFKWNPSLGRRRPEVDREIFPV